MGLTINNIKVVESRKRIEADATFKNGLLSAIFGGGDPEYSATFRLVSPDPFPEGSEEEWLTKIHEQRNNWKQGKKPQNKWVRIENSSATGYIVNYSETGEESTKLDAPEIEEA